MAKSYIVPINLKGCDVYTTPPPFIRRVENQGKFELDKCTQKELAYLAEVHNYPLEVAETQAKETAESKSDSPAE